MDETLPSGIDDPEELMAESRDSERQRANTGVLETDVLATLPVQDRPTARACVEAAKQDAVVRLGIGHDSVKLDSIERRDWPNSGLGVEQAGQIYAQMITAGYLIRLRANGQVYAYHSDMQGRVIAAF